MWKGWVIDESLEDSNILSKTRITNTVLEDNSQGSKKVIWTIYTVEVEDNKIDDVVKDLEKMIKPTWYTHFTNKKELIVIFHGKSFRLKLKKTGEEKDVGTTDFWIDPAEKKTWKAAVEYGSGKGKVDSRYMLNVK